MLLLASLLKEKFTKQAKTTKRGRLLHKLSVNISIAAIFLSLINLPPFEGMQKILWLKIGTILPNLLAGFICACSVGGRKTRTGHLKLANLQSRLKDAEKEFKRLKMTTIGVERNSNQSKLSQRKCQRS